MDKFVKGENEMRKMPAKERIQTRMGAEKRVLDFRHQLSVCPATHLKMFRQKETPIGAIHILCLLRAQVRYFKCRRAAGVLIMEATLAFSRRVRAASR